MDTRTQRLQRISSQLVKDYHNRYGRDEHFTQRMDKLLQNPRKLLFGEPFWKYVKTAATTLAANSGSKFYEVYSKYGSTISGEQIQDLFKNIPGKDLELLTKEPSPPSTIPIPQTVTPALVVTPIEEAKAPPESAAPNATAPKEEVKKEEIKEVEKTEEIKEAEKTKTTEMGSAPENQTEPSLSHPLPPTTPPIQLTPQHQPPVSPPSTNEVKLPENLRPHPQAVSVLERESSTIQTVPAPQPLIDNTLGGKPVAAADLNNFREVLWQNPPSEQGKTTSIPSLEKGPGLLNKVRNIIPSRSFFTQNARKFFSSSPIQGALSWGQIAARKVIIRYAPALISSTIGGIAGFGLTRTAAGAAVGALGGGAISTGVGMGVARGVGGVALKLAGRAALASNPVGLAVLAATMAPQILKKAKKLFLRNVMITTSIVVAFFLILLGPGDIDLLKSSSLVGPFATTEAAELGSPPPSISPPPPGSGGQIASCTFYRSGDSVSGLNFRIAEWPALIEEVASKVGVPPAVLAGILRIECPDCFYSNNPDYIKNDYDAHTNGLVYGVMQFYPPTFQNVFNTNQPEMQSLFGKTIVTTNIDPQSSMAPNNVLRIYSIRDSLIAAAFKVRADAGGTPPYTQTNIDNIVKAYFTTCTYTQGGGTYSYCNDLWQSYSQCQQSTGITPSPSISPPPVTTQVCKGDLASFNATMMLLPLPKQKPICEQTLTGSCGRPGFCTTPTKIVLHTTWSPVNAVDTYNYFANGSPSASGLAGVGSHFIIDKDGSTLQLVDLYRDKTEVAWAVAGYVDHISIEIVNNGDYSGKSAMPSVQYQATLSLVRSLMQQYNITLGNLEYTWKTPSNTALPNLVGVFGHYQLNPQTKTDPGAGLVRDIRTNLK
ncbi:MAG: N-acetylmuramoyl-L-alanine amidase [bacterium]|nr:N-acetylmuramoyl-L-alanine amidase [bacterium]